MLLAIWPLFMGVPQMGNPSRHIEHLEKQSQRNLARTRAKLNEQANLARLQRNVNERTNDLNTSQTLDIGSISGGIKPVGTLSAALGASHAASDSLPFKLKAAMKMQAKKQLEDDEMAIVILMMGM